MLTDENAAPPATQVEGDTNAAPAKTADAAPGAVVRDEEKTPVKDEVGTVVRENTSSSQPTK